MKKNETQYALSNAIDYFLELWKRVPNFSILFLGIHTGSDTCECRSPPFGRDNFSVPSVLITRENSSVITVERGKNIITVRFFFFNFHARCERFYVAIVRIQEALACLETYTPVNGTNSTHRRFSKRIITSRKRENVSKKKKKNI